MELYEEKEVDLSFVALTRHKIIHAYPSQHEARPKIVILVSHRFLQEALIDLEKRNAVLEPDLHPNNGCTTIRNSPVVAVPWLKDDEFEYWSNAENCVPA